jgi:uncharacterized SAM-binding protein YcdF (DUF218 family)
MSRFRLVLVGWRVAVAIAVPITVAVVVFAVLTYQRILSPAQDVPEPSDAVVMLAGGRGERLDVALALMDDDLAPVLVVMNGLNWSKGFRLCTDGSDDFEVVCPSGPGDTRGEGREIRALADERGWESIILVTSDFHLHRATTNVERCFGGTIHRVAAENQFGTGRMIQAVIVEWAGAARNVVRRGC